MAKGRVTHLRQGYGGQATRPYMCDDNCILAKVGTLLLRQLTDSADGGGVADVGATRESPVHI